MTSQAFEAALSEPNSNASHSRLHELIKSQNFSKLNPPAIAGTYLRAFCDAKSSHIRRRWVGIALARMIEESWSAVDYLKQQHRELLGLGGIILSDTEREEIKIAAGIVIRQALQHGIEYSLFWETEKVKNSVPTFPAEPSPRWMSAFQSFLDTLGDLALSNPAADPSIIYAIAITASDGFKWRDSTEELLVAIVQAGLLTIIALGSTVGDYQFVDIPVAHIGGVQTRRSSLYDSQARNTNHEPWDLVISLKAETWTYRLNTSNRTGNEVILLFERSDDAKELETCIKEHQTETKASVTARRKAHPNMSASSPINTGPLLSTNAKSSLKQLEQQRIAQSQPFVQTKDSQGPASSDDHLNASPLRAQTRPSQVRQGNKDKDTTKSSGYYLSGKQSHGNKRTEVQNLSGCKSISDATPSLEQTESTISGFKNKDSSQGKLKKVSHDTKMKAAKQLYPPSDVYDLREGSQDPQTNNDTKGSAVPLKLSQKQSQKPKAAKSEASSQTKRPKTRSKRKAEDDDNDDEFVPDEKKSKRLKTTARKTRSSAVIKPPVSDTNVDSRILSKTAPNKNGTKFDAENGLSKKQQPKAGRSNKQAPSPLPQRHPLIDGLLDSKPSVQSADESFVRPEVPDQSSPAPSIPTQSSCEIIETPQHPQTPKDIRKRPNTGASSHISSSQLGTETRGSWVNRARGRIDIEILSSNSKPVPASPTAESTAISGHADCHHIDQEKKEGESQTAKSDPFRQKSSNQKATLFTRRLTGEVLAEKIVELEDDRSECMVNDVSSELRYVNEIVPSAASEPLPQRTSQRMEDCSTRASEFKAQSLGYPQSPSKQAARVTSKPKEIMSVTSKAHVLPKGIVKQAPKPMKQKSEIRTYSRVANRERPLPLVTPIKTAPPFRELLEGKMGTPIRILGQQIGENTRTSEPVKTDSHEDCDGDVTLVNDVEDQRASYIDPSSIHFRSSPPISNSASSNTSTAIPHSSPSESPIPTSEAEEMEWEASLQPHQRSLHDLLIRVSKRVMRHVVDNETAIIDIADMYADDGEHLLNVLYQQDNNNFEHVFQDMEDKAKWLRKELDGAVRQVVKERKRVSAMV